MTIHSTATQSTATQSTEQNPDMYEVCGLVVLTRQESFLQVRTYLNNMNGVDIHCQDACGKFAITVEEMTHTPLITEQIDSIRDTPGVVDVALAFSQCENLSDALPVIAPLIDDHTVNDLRNSHE